MPRKTIIERSATVEADRIGRTPDGQGADPEEGYWRGLFAVSEHWKADLQFFRDELNFFRVLIDRYFLPLIQRNNMDDTRLLVSSLAKLDTQRSKLDQKVAEHLQHLTNLMESPFAHNAQEYKAEHAGLEKLMARFVKDFRGEKQEAFRMADIAMEAEKDTRLVGKRLGREGEKGSYIVKKNRRR